MIDQKMVTFDPLASTLVSDKDGRVVSIRPHTLGKIGGNMGALPAYNGYDRDFLLVWNFVEPNIR